MTSVKQENRYRKLARQLADIKTAHQSWVAQLSGQRQAVVPPEPAASRRKVRAWMRRACADEEYDDATQLAEAANAALELPPGAMDDPDHWIWEEAAEALPAH